MRRFELPQTTPMLIVISGPSGAGKDSVLAGLKERNLAFHFVVTATNRPQRANEVNGVDYFFVSTDEFATLIEKDDLLEYANVYGQYKGIPKQQVREALASGRDVIMRIDVQGAATIKQLYPDALLIFIATESEADLTQRLLARQTETLATVKLRVATARKEMQRLSEFDYCVVNRQNDLENAVSEILAIIKAEHLRVKPRRVQI